MRIYHVGSLDLWDMEKFQDPKTGQKFEVPTSQLCLDCWTTALDVDSELKVTRVIHDKTCPQVASRKEASR